MDLEEKNRLAGKGSHDALKALLEAGIYSLNLAELYKVELAGSGFTAEMLAAMSGTQATLSAAMADRRAGQVDAQLATGAELAVMVASKAYIYRLRQALPIAIRGVDLSDLKPEQVAPPGRLGKSTPKVLEFLKNSRVLVGRVDNQLKPFFGGQSALAQHEKLTADLEVTQGNQVTKQATLAPATFELRVLKGQLLEMIEDLNRIGRIAFMGRAEIAGKFNKDILLKARRKRAKGEAADQGEASEKKTVTAVSV